MRALAAGLAPLAALPVFLILLFAGPITSYRRVPLVPPSGVKLYQDAAASVSQATRTAHDPKGIQIPWEPMLAIHAVRYEQALPRSRPEIEELAWSFADRHERTETYCSGEGEERVCWTETIVWYTLRTHEQVMDRLGFTPAERDWAREMLQTDLALLADVGVDCVPPGWVPEPQPGWVWPVPRVHTVTSCYGPRIDPIEHIDGMHSGLDLGAPAGAPVVAARPGTVAFSGPAGPCGVGVTIQHSSGLSTRYCHLMSALVRSGQRVAAGQTIGLAGSTGRSTGPHLHFEVFAYGKAQDPLLYYRSSSNLAPAP